MKNPRILIALILPGLWFLLAFNGNKPIVKEREINEIMNQNSFEIQKKYSNEYDFWMLKLLDHPNQFPYLTQMANYQNRLFDCSGNFHYLHTATSQLEKAKKLSFSRDVAVLQKLARNYIKMHRFCEAEDVLQTAESLGQNARITKCIQFDVYMELGHYEIAEDLLREICHTEDFEAYIRKSKWADHSGDLDQAVFLMERAMKIAEKSKNESLILWSYTNLADFYGHQNRIYKSYDYFLKSLKIDPSNHYAKKGIAWISFAHDHNPKLSQKILESINTYYDSPSYDLFKAELAQYLGNNEVYELLSKNFLTKVNSNHSLKHMYGPEIVEKLLEQNKLSNDVMDIVINEISMRPIASSYALKAKVLHAMGQKEMATNIVLDNVVNKTFEPAPLLIAAEILKENEINTKIIEDLKSELSTAVYELGPQSEKVIDTL